MSRSIEIVQTPCTQSPVDKSIFIGTQNSGLPPAPKVIWTYWKGCSIPKLVEACISSWRFFHPDWMINVVTPSTLNTYIPTCDLNLQLLNWVTDSTREADVVRAHLLSRFGGVWLDATFLLAAPLTFVDGVLTPDGPAFTGFYIQGFTRHICWPVIENWAFAARPGSVFLQRWLQTFMSTPNSPKGCAELVARLRMGGLDFQHIPRLLQNYLAMHCAAQYVLQSATASAATSFSMHLFQAEQGPLKYLADTKFMSLAAVWKLMTAFHPRKPNPKYTAYKLRSLERKALLPCQQARLLKRMRYAHADDIKS